QIRAEGVACDVTSRDSLRVAALETIAKFGKAHMVCNNAGIGAGGPMGLVSPGDWDWVLDVNLKGVFYGMEIFTPLIESHGEGGWFVNTASMAGMLSPPMMEPYSATKFAVVAMSEGWAVQLAPKGIGVSILCPGFVKTNIIESRRNRSAAYGPDTSLPLNPDAPVSGVLTGIPPEAVGKRVVEGIKDGDLYIFTHPEFKAATQARFDRILAAFDKSATSPAINALPPRTAPGLNLPQ
ncbi:MAG TPA: SDR family NAD(P)-dependent oxidoreductase, partial [Caulobacteraceae bacterium]|nr:SDR family NAD(P)-dependent oxidoreductase [Caulobacteraceae bacterium]